MTTSILTPRQTFRETVALVAAKAKEKLPQAVNGRVESAVKLVLAGDVFFLDDGTVEVGSSDPTRYYKLVGTTCTCTDFTSGKAPDGWCKHRTAAGIQKRVQETLGQDQDYPGNLETPAAPAPLPEAPASVNCHITIEGRQVQLTLRDSDEARLIQRLATILQHYPLPAPAQASSPLSPQQHNAAAMHKRVTDFCPVHNVQMQENEKAGRRWFSHRTDQGWCKGR